MEQFVTQFGIDWKLMIAQLINFAIVFFVLKKFAYKPILKMLDDRKQKIEEGLSFAEKAKNELASIETVKKEEALKAQQQGVAIVKEAELAATRVREEIVAGGEVEKQKLLATGKALLSEQKNRMEKSVYDEAVGLIEASLGKILGKKEFKTEEREIIAATISEIRVQ